MSEKLKVLVIDDSMDDRLLYRRALQKSAEAIYDIFEADDGDAGIAQMDAEPPACVLLDYSLPGRNGVEVLKRIRSRHPHVPVVMLTGQGNEKVAVAAMQHGAQHYISKSSITAETLEGVIRIAIEHCMLQKRIHEQAAALEIFSRALAHDLKEPVRTIEAFADLILQQVQLPEPTQQHFRFIQSAAERMHMLIDTVFMYTRLDAPGEIVRESCDTAAIVQEVQENLARLTAERGAHIACGVLPVVYANRMQLIQVFQNLVSNAIQHSELPVSIYIEAYLQGDNWLFSVTDNGPGIEAAHLEKIFDPFKRMTQVHEQGAGLGLSICRKIIELHGGRIWGVSAPGGGCSFKFTLPKVVLIPMPAHRVTEHDSPMSGYSEKPLANILVVDDSRADIEMVRFRLIERSRLQCNLSVARDAVTALDRLRNDAHENGPIDLVLLDINMPETDGFEVLERIRADDKLHNISVVMCTGSTYDKDIARAHALGASGYMTKPIEFAKLQSILKQMPSVMLQSQDNGYRLLRTG